MARINVEDTLWSDPRFMRLVALLGDEFKAAGVVLIAWKTAQRYWCPDRAPIPENVFQSSLLPEALLESGLAERSTAGVRMRGSEEHFSWWFEKRSAGSKGGTKAAQRRKKLPVVTQALLEQKQAVLEQSQAESSESNPLTPPPPLSPTTSSSSEQISETPEALGPISLLANVRGATELLAEVKHRGQKAWIIAYGLELVRTELPKIYAKWESDEERAAVGGLPKYVNDWFKNLVDNPKKSTPSNGARADPGKPPLRKTGKPCAQARLADGTVISRGCAVHASNEVCELMGRM